MTSYSLLLELRHAGWDFSGHVWFMRLSLAQPSSGEQSITITDIHEIKKYAQVKVIFTFEIESVSSCLFIHYIYTIHSIIIKLDDVGIKEQRTTIKEQQNCLWTTFYQMEFMER